MSAAPQEAPRPSNDSGRTTQNSGELYSVIEALRPHLPRGYGALRVEEVLGVLQESVPEVFNGLNRLQEKLASSSGLSDAVAEKCKEKGNNEFKENKFLESIASYNLGLVHAASDEMVATLLNNRSTAFYKLRRFADSCIDAHQCLALKPDYWKTLARRGSALQALGFSDVGEKDILASEAQDESKANTMNDLEKILGDALSPTRISEAPKTKIIAGSIKLKDKVTRKGIVASQKINAGTTIVEETPYASASRMEVLLSSCSFCLHHTICLFSGAEFRKAQRKSRGLFCSTACATASWKECLEDTESGNVFFLCCPTDALLAHRLLRRVEKYPSLREWDDSDTESSWSEKNGVDANHVMHMPFHISRELFPAASVGGSETIVSAIGLYMKAYSSSEADSMRLAQRIILLKGVDVSCHIRRPTPFGSNPSHSGAETSSASTVLVGTGIFAVASSFTHSCDPNCYLSFLGNPQNTSSTAVVRVIRDVIPGEELTVAYNGLTRFKTHSKSSRINMLRQRYGFVCQCSSCLNDVDQPVSAEEKEKYIKASDYYQKGCRLIREGDFSTAATVLLQSYEIVMRYICPPPRPPQPMLPATHQSIALAYHHLHNTPKCVEHLKAALEIDIQIHGTDNRAEMIPIYSRLSSIAIRMEDREEYARKAIELLERFYAPSPLLSLTVRLTKSIAASSPPN